MKRSNKVITSEAVKKARETLGETQEQFADRIGIDQGTVSRWEAGKLPRKGMTQAFLRRVLEDIGRVIPVR